MSTLKEMTPTQAADLALQTILSKMDFYGGKNGYDYMREEYDYDPDDENGTSLSDIDRAWSTVKYEAGSDEYELDGFTAKMVAEHGGEGEGDQYWVVVSVSDGETTRYFRRDGWYASYDGGYLDGPTSEVKPQERVVTFYE